MTPNGYALTRLRREEGFAGKPYDDHLGVPTIGYGTTLPLTEREAMLLLEHRAENTWAELRDRLHESDTHLCHLPDSVRAALLDMAYNLGVPRLMGFKRMLRAVKECQWADAGDECMDSRYARQVPNRAKRNADLLRRAGALT